MVELGGEPRFERWLRVVVVVVEAERIAGREELGESAFAAPLQVALVVGIEVPGAEHFAREPLKETRANRAVLVL